MNKHSSNNRGSATILTLLISAVVITIGIGFNWIVKEHLKAAEGLRNKSEAMVSAKSTYDTLIYSILTGRMSSKEIVLTAGEELLGISKIPLNGQSVGLNEVISISLQDSNGKFSLFSPNATAMRRLIEIIREGGEDISTGIIDSFLDWIDQDKLVRLNGAEDFFYSAEGKPYSPRNYSIQYIEETGLIKGIDEDIYKKLLPCFTMLPNTGFNPNTANDEVLMAYLNIDRDVLETLRSYISEKPVTSDSQLFSITGRRIASMSEGVYFFPSGFIDITINAGNPRKIGCIKAGIYISQQINSPYNVAYWKEE